MTVEIRTLRPDDDRRSSHSGDEALDLYFHRYAGQNQFRHHIGVSYVAVEDDALLGFVTVSPATLDSEELAQGRRMPPYPVPVLRVARLATHEEARGRGIGLALVRFNRLSDAARWLRDWRERKSVEPWMVFNFCLGLRHLGRYGEATTVARFVLKHWGHREGAEDMHLFLAVEDALAGRVPDAEEHLARIEVRKGVEHDEQLFALAKALVEFQQLPLPERRRRFRETRTALDVHVGPLPLARAMRDVRRTFGRAVQLFHRNGGGVQARLWGAWNLYWYHLVLPLSILIWLWRRL